MDRSPRPARNRGQAQGLRPARKPVPRPAREPASGPARRLRSGLVASLGRLPGRAAGSAAPASPPAASPDRGWPPGNTRLASGARAAAQAPGALDAPCSVPSRRRSRTGPARADRAATCRAAVTGTRLPGTGAVRVRFGARRYRRACRSRYPSRRRHPRRPRPPRRLLCPGQQSLCRSRGNPHQSRPLHPQWPPQDSRPPMRSPPRLAPPRLAPPRLAPPRLAPPRLAPLKTGCLRPKQTRLKLACPPPRRQRHPHPSRPRPPHRCLPSQRRWQPRQRQRTPPQH